MDDLDRAQQVEELERAAALSCRQSGFDLPSNSECEECGEEVPEQRRQLGGVRYCIECQRYFELLREPRNRK
ncbi:TraR/DksA C4-type zinc finger protein [Endozoicomonas ascidiicola]|uniref:TraR/DksA C4-type zinc finger protein n=1 Tax=Endozoicomonas ascidiicola TaxID=1698521 RepID=UPI00082A3D6E|nr:TraR/DksA C4-type zinc finger protein [Endozoicomonas ascidiicola]